MDIRLLTRLTIVLLVGCGLLLLPRQGAFGQQIAEEPETTSAEGASDTSALDKLLDMADQDMSALTRVHVTAPALDMEVTSVSRQVSTVGRSPAAVFVITNEMVRRSGARSIPEILRMAPGVQVARIDASKWAISIRGSSGRFSNKLLVQIDGRSVYTPLFGGVFWDVQDVVLEDIERIEVIRGPGATVWGANAVNGIINVITKSSFDTRGALVQGGAGTEERGFVTARYGGQLGEDATYRVYGKWFDRDAGFDINGGEHDDWRMGRGGFRTDWQATCDDVVTFQGDFYTGVTGRENQYPDPMSPQFTTSVIDDADVNGGNLLGRWTRQLGDESNLALQIYYDRTSRAWPAFGLRNELDTFDVDFQHRFPLFERHALIWGMEYRRVEDMTRSVPPIVVFEPTRRSLDFLSYFVQDEIEIVDDALYFTVGSKFLHNEFTDFEFQPTARVLWAPNERYSLWTSISRAIRLPTIAERDGRILLSSPLGVQPNPFPPPAVIPMYGLFEGNHDFESEDLLAYEIGARGQPADWLSWDLAVFFHNYSDVRRVPFGSVVQPGYPILLPGRVDNGERAQTYGFEWFSKLVLDERWRVFGGYSFLVTTGNLGSDVSDPRNQVYLQSSWDLGEHLQLDAIWRYVDNLAFQNLDRSMTVVPHYNALDLRLAWHCTPGWELAVVGRNLIDAGHFEYNDDLFLGNTRTEVPREIYGMMTWKY